FGKAIEIFVTPKATLSVMEDDPAEMTCSGKLFESMVNQTCIESLEIAKKDYTDLLVLYHRSGYSI
ncbi:hypothetical protein BgiMline_036102, partial [Biomphalaria glabrata]